MSEMAKISEAILDKVRVEADQIIKEAEEKALEEVRKAEKQLEARFETEKRKVLEEANRKADRTLAEASVKARQELARTKADIVDRITSKVKVKLQETSSDESSLLSLTREAINSINADKVKAYVAAKDMTTIQTAIKKDETLAGNITSVEEYNCSGGVLVESVDGKLRADNTYDTRLEMLLPQILPELDRKLFGTS